MNFRRPSTEVRARQLDGLAEIDTPEGTVVGEPGQWMVEHADGTRHVRSDEAFRDTYQRATIAAKKTPNEPERAGE